MPTEVHDASELDRWVALYNTAADFPSTVEEQLAYSASWPDSARFLAGDSGCAWIFAETGFADLPALWVRPDRRRRGTGTLLYDAVSNWARARGLDRIDVVVRDEEPDGLAFALARGFVEVSREARAGLDLTTAAPRPVEPPAGVEIVTWEERPDLARALYEVVLEAAPDIPGHTGNVAPFERWLREDMQGPNDRPDATFVALAGGEVVGFAKFHFPAAGTTLAHDLTGVRRAWRGQGIARALKAHQIAWARAAGYERLLTDNELRNAPIRKLNAEFGYRPIPGRARLRGPLAEPARRRPGPLGHVP